MEEDSNLPPSKRQKSLNLKNCYVFQDESSKKKVNFYILTIFKETRKKLLGVTFVSEFNFALFFNRYFKHFNIFALKFLIHQHVSSLWIVDIWHFRNQKFKSIVIVIVACWESKIRFCKEINSISGGEIQIGWNEIQMQRAHQEAW